MESHPLKDGSAKAGLLNPGVGVVGSGGGSAFLMALIFFFSI